MDESQLPLLFLDVDGPLNPYAANPTRRPAGYLTYRYPYYARRGDQLRLRHHRVWLSAAHGPVLLGLPFQLAWGTSWEQDANTWVAPKIGLPQLPVAHLERTAASELSGHVFEHSGRFIRPALSWKIPWLLEFAAGRPFAWVDDEVGVNDARYVADHSTAPALLHWVSPRVGLTEDDFNALRKWAEELTSPPVAARP